MTDTQEPPTQPKTFEERVQGTLASIESIETDKAVDSITLESLAVEARREEAAVEAEVATGAIPTETVHFDATVVDPLEALRKRLASAQVERDNAVKDRDLYSRSAPQYASADERVRKADAERRSVEESIRSQERTLKDYFDAKRAYELADKEKDSGALQAAHDQAMRFFESSRASEMWTNALLGVDLARIALESIAKLEAEHAAALKSTREEQIASLRALKSEVGGLESAAKAAALELEKLQKQMAEAKQRIAEIEKKESGDVSEAKKLYSKAAERASEQLAKMATPKKQTRPIPVQAAPARSNKKQSPEQSEQPQQQQQQQRIPAPVADDKRAAPRKPRVPNDLSTPFSKQESEAVWTLLMMALGRTGDTSAVTITRREFTRATSSDEQLKALFGVDLRQRFRAIDNDSNQRISKTELRDWLAFPSMRRSRTPSFGAVRDAMALFDAVKDGTGRIQDEEFELA